MRTAPPFFVCALAVCGAALAHCGQPSPAEQRDGAPRGEEAAGDASGSAREETGADDATAPDEAAELDAALPTDVAPSTDERPAAMDAPETVDTVVFVDSGSRDQGSGVFDAGSDVRSDAVADAARTDAVARTDAAVVDVAADAVRVDSGRPDAGGCISGSPGSRALRVQWYGSSGSSSSTAAVRYEANDLPDRTRWRVTPNSRSIGYRPVFTDVFLGEGGLELSGTGFIDVELSTAGLASISRVTVAVYGRSFNTTASGSFRWQTFAGTGASPANLVANSAPYEWYGADATDAFEPGDDGVLLRIYPGPSSSALIVNRLEVCFDAR